MSLWYHNIVISDDKFLFVMSGGRDYQKIKEERDSLGGDYYIMKVGTIIKSDKILKIHKNYIPPKEVNMDNFECLSYIHCLHKFNAVCYNELDYLCISAGFNLFSSCRKYIDSNTELSLFTMKDTTIKEKKCIKRIHKDYKEKKPLGFDMDDFN